MNERMVAQENVALAGSLVELFNSRQSDPAWLEKSLAAFAADCEAVNAASGTTFHGPEGYKRFMRFFAENFPDLRKELTKVFATEDQVILEGIFRDTTTRSRTLPTGALKASGRPGAARCCDVLYFRHGKIARFNSYY